MLDIETKTSDEVVEVNDAEKNVHSRSLKKIIYLLQVAVDKSVNENPIMNRSLLFKHSCGLAIQVYEYLHKDYRRKITYTNACI